MDLHTFFLITLIKTDENLVFDLKVYDQAKNIYWVNEKNRKFSMAQKFGEQSILYIIIVHVYIVLYYYSCL